MSSPATPELPTVVTADDHPATRLGVRMALTRGGFRVVAEAADCEGAVDAVLEERPDVCLLDVRMPGGGIEAARRVKESGVKTSVVMLTVSQDSGDVLAALRVGAIGYLPKDTSPDRLPAALVGVLTGEAALPRALVPLVLRSLQADERPSAARVRVRGVELSARESEVLRLLRSGMKTVEVSEALSLSPVTVRRHISAGVAKLGVADRDAAIRALGTTAVA